jgi:endonuclease YncB( thermonuclease family)
MSRIRFSWFALLLLLTSVLPAARRTAPPALPGILEGQVTQVADGDTFTLADDARHAFRIRILGIDAPELAQPFGKVSRQVLVNRILHQRLQVLVQSRDRRGLVLCQAT